MNTGSRAMHHTRPQAESKDADPNPPIKIHGPLANTLFLRAIDPCTKKQPDKNRDNTCKSKGTCAQNLHHHHPPPPKKKRKDLAPPKMQGSGQKRKDFDPPKCKEKCKEKTQGSKKTRIGRSGWSTISIGSPNAVWSKSSYSRVTNVKVHAVSLQLNALLENLEKTSVNCLATYQQLM